MSRLLIAGIFLLATAQNTYADFSAEGNLAYTNDHALINFQLLQHSKVTIWTDSFLPGFDPIISLYDTLGTQIAQNDDHPIYHHIILGQDFFDSTLFKLDLLSGDYTLAVTTYDFFPGNNLSTAFDNIPTGTALSSPESYYHVNFVITAVPEPETYVMLLIGLILISFTQYRKYSKTTLPIRNH